ncbi:MAG: glycine--tRNA ligase subunit beta [Deltaproteobacteria bacterium]
MSDLLLELGSEELPARFVNPAAAELQARLMALLAEARLAHGEVTSFGTPRRLAVLVRGLAERQPDVERDVIGPPVKAAFDPDGKPRPAAEGFARTHGLSLSQLSRQQTPKGEYLAARVKETGKPTGELLPGLCLTALSKLSFPKAMRWGSEDVTWARPLQWICALHGAAPLALRYGDVESGGTTRGHRFLAPSPFALGAPAAYADRLRETKVLAAFDERRARIQSLAEEAARAVGGRLVPDPELLDQVANLVEWPTALAGHFDPGHLTLPREVLISELKGHQRYFAVEGDGSATSGKLLPCFVAVSATPVKDPDVSRHGYERVLRARLADARFFFDADKKATLESRVAALGAIVFQQKLGTSLEKVERFTALTEWLAERLRLTEPLAAVAVRAARLCKADLTTGMVGEFPELQGVMGREYALASGESPAVAQAIEEHYLPRFSGDRLPEEHAGALVGLADRLDTLAGLFGVGKVPTGAADPFALRRACLGVIHVTLARGYRYSLSAALDRALELLGPKLTVPAAEAKAQLAEFFRARLRALWLETHPPDLVEAILAPGFDDVWATRGRLSALAAVRSAPEFLPLASAYKRAVNILEKAAEKEMAELAGGKPGQNGAGYLDQVDGEKLVEDAERALYKAALVARQRSEQALEKDDFTAALAAATALKPAIDLFFDKVLVMAEDRDVRRNRLRLLGAVRELFATVADLSQIQLEGTK